MFTYNVKMGPNTVLRGLIAEEVARYVLVQRMPILILRPSVVLDYIDRASIKGNYIDFIRKNQQTMDFLGFTPYYNKENLRITTEEIIYRFFYRKEGLTSFLLKDPLTAQLKGFVIEVKSRTSTSSWAPFQFSFSPNQVDMLNQCRKLNFEVILCGVTIGSGWNLTVVFCDANQKILPEKFFEKVGKKSSG